MTQQKQVKTGLSTWQHGVAFLLACAVIISRRPDAIFNAQFRYEDGTVWYANAYQVGWWAALFHPWQGYYEILPRLAASLALLVPLSRAPLVLALIAIAVQALPVSLLLSSRSSAWGNLRFRACMAAIFLALPIYGEIGAIMTCAMWFHALSAFLVVVASKPRSAREQFFDLCILSLCGSTGPFCFLLLPVAIYLAWMRGDPRPPAPVCVLVALSVIQAWSLLIMAPNARPHSVLGAGPVLFGHLLASKVYLGTLLGSNGLAVHPGLSLSIFLLVIALGGTVLVCVCFLDSPLEMKLFILFAGGLFAAALVSPMLGRVPGLTAWQVLASLGESRYWFFSMLAFAWSILWCVESRIPIARAVSIVLLCVMSFGVIREWRQPALRDMHFADDASRFEAAPVGTIVTIPEGTPPWAMTLVKHPPSR